MKLVTAHNRQITANDTVEITAINDTNDTGYNFWRFLPPNTFFAKINKNHG